jgi:hypothetical protein
MTKTIVTTFFSACCTFAVTACSAESQAVRLPGAVLKPFVQKNCARCHGEKKQKGKLRLDTLSLTIGNDATAQRWQDVLDALNAGDMPPEDEKQPAKQELTSVLGTLTNGLKDARRQLSDQGSEITMRRLNQREYVNTIESLFGFSINSDSLPEDDPSDTFDTIGSQQYFSSYHFEKYLDQARVIISDAFHWGNRGRQKSKTQIEELEKRTNKNIRDALTKRMARWREVVAALEAGKTWKDGDFPRTLKGERFDGRELHFYLNFHAERSSGPQAYLKKEFIHKGIYLSRQAGARWSAGIVRHHYDPRATYKIRILGGINEEPPESRMFVSSNDRGRVLPPLRIYGTAHKNEMIEVTHKPLHGGTHFQFQILERWNSMIDGKKYVKKFIDPHGDWASIFVDRMEVEGPFYGESTFFEELAFPQGPPPRNKRIQRTDDDAKNLIRKFAFEAFRRAEPDAVFLKRLHNLYDLGRSSGLEVEEALVDPFAVVLSSPGFIYLSETKAEEKTNVPLTDRELAIRLAFFLWSRPPDEELYSAAAEGSLRREAILRAQVERMLADEKSHAFTSAFMSQWFDLHRFDEIVVNPDEYPNFDDELRYSARREPIRFFEQLLKEDLPMTALIDSDFVVVDPILALHYGIDGVKGQGFRKVSVPKESPRGGLLGTTAFMTMGSTGDRTSPIIRGTLILQKFLHNPPADPPPNVPELSDATKKPLPIRQMIELHQSKPQCASCHAKIDPIGYGLETFDAIGLWRDRARVGKELLAIEPGGMLPGGENYKDFKNLKTLLLGHKDRLAQSLIEGVMSYGLGRSVEFSDGDRIRALTQKLIDDNYGMKSLIHNFVQSDVFQTK